MGRLGRAVRLRNRQGSVGKAGIGGGPLVLLPRPTSAAGRPRSPAFGAKCRPERRNPRGKPCSPPRFPPHPLAPLEDNRMSYPSQKRRLRPAPGVAAAVAALMAAGAGLAALPSAFAVSPAGQAGTIQTMGGSTVNYRQSGYGPE